MEVTISISKDITENFKKLKVPFKKIMDLVRSDFNYSAGTFLNNYRNKDNYENYQDLMIFDIDDGKTIIEAKKLFEPYSYILATTKSHQVNKNGLICDRYRIILPLEKCMTVTSIEYGEIMTEIMKDYDFIDKACKDSSRFYYPFKDSEVFYHDGFMDFDWIPYFQKSLQVRKEREIETERLKKFYESINKRKEIDYGFTTERIDYIRKIMFTDKILELLHFEKFSAGGRNNYLYALCRYFQNVGLENEEIKKAVIWFNSKGDGISETEISQTIFKSLRI